jgi:clan AA aspartic protease
MIIGEITLNREAVIELEIIGSYRRKENIEAVIDTGFNGYLTLPNDLINRLKLRLAGNRRATLGDGYVVVLDVYFAKLSWQGQEREILALQADGNPLVGMSLLYGSRVMLDVIDNGEVTIEPLP